MAPLATTAVFEDIPPAIRGSAEAVNYAARKVLGRLWSAPSYMYFIRSGEVRLARSGRAGETLILQRVRQGWVAEASLFATKYHCDLVTSEPTACVRVRLQAISQALEVNSDFAREWACTLSSELRRLRNACERMSLRTGEQRVVHAIECEGSRGRIDLPGTLKDWASELGLTHEALYRTIARMEASGRLRREGPSLVLVR